MIPWTPERVERLRQLADGTRSARQIGAEMGCSRNAIIARIDRSGGKDGRLTSGRMTERKERIAERVANPPQRRLFKRKTSKTPPQFPAAEAPQVEVPEIPPIPFMEAVEQKKCLFFAGDPFAPASEMHVCGAERQRFGVFSRYCKRHKQKSVWRY